MNFGEKLKSLRTEQNMTQETLANLLGIKKQSISRYENSEREPNIKTAKRLADALGVSLEALATGNASDIPDSSTDFSVNPVEIAGIYNALNRDGQKELRRYGTYLMALDQYKAIDNEPQVEYIRHYLTAAAAGYAAPIEGEDYELVPRDISVPVGADFCIDIDGDSMEPYIKHSQRVYVQQNVSLKEFDVGIFFVDGDVYCKQWCKDYDGTLHLLSANPKRKDANISVHRDSGRSVVCFGKVLVPKLPQPVYDSD